MEEGQAEAILQKCCPLEYKDLKEEEVKATNPFMCADSSHWPIALMSNAQC